MTTWEGGTRIPFCVQWRGKLPAGKTYDHPVVQLDILPTALAAAGVDIKPEWKLDGVNLLPYLTGENTEQPHETLYWRYGDQWAVRHGDWKLVAGNGGDLKNGELYNLAEDVSESKNRAAEMLDKVKELKSLWDKWNAEQAPLRFRKKSRPRPSRPIGRTRTNNRTNGETPRRKLPQVDAEVRALNYRTVNHSANRRFVVEVLRSGLRIEDEPLQDGGGFHRAGFCFLARLDNIGFIAQTTGSSFNSMSAGSEMYFNPPQRRPSGRGEVRSSCKSGRDPRPSTFGKHVDLDACFAMLKFRPAPRRLRKNVKTRDRRGLQEFIDPVHRQHNVDILRHSANVTMSPNRQPSPTTASHSHGANT